MFITHFHLLAVYAQIIKICSTIKWPESGWKGPEWPEFRELWKLERMGQSIETALLSRSDLTPVHDAIRETFRHLNSANPTKRSHENMCNNLRKVQDTVDTLLQTSPRLPLRPLGMVEQSDLEHFDRPYAYV